MILRWRVTKINDIHDFTGYCYFQDRGVLGGCFLPLDLLALSLGADRCKFRAKTQQRREATRRRSPELTSTFYRVVC